MTIFSTLALLIATLAGFAGYVLFVAYPRSAVDATRDKLFCLRSKLFDLARNEKVSFEHRGYTAARDLLNGMIRYAHDVSATHLLFATVFPNREARALRKAISRAIQHDLDSLPRSAKKDVEELLSEASICLAELVVCRSVLLSVVVMAYAALRKVFVDARELMRRASRVQISVDLPYRAHRNGVHESLHEMMDNTAMRRVPRLVRRESARYAVNPFSDLRQGYAVTA